MQYLDILKNTIEQYIVKNTTIRTTIKVNIIYNDKINQYCPYISLRISPLEIYDETKNINLNNIVNNMLSDLNLNELKIQKELEYKVMNNITYASFFIIPDKISLEEACVLLKMSHFSPF